MNTAPTPGPLEIILLLGFLVAVAASAIVITYRAGRSGRGCIGWPAAVVAWIALGNLAGLIGTQNQAVFGPAIVVGCTIFLARHERKKAAQERENEPTDPEALAG